MPKVSFRATPQRRSGLPDAKGQLLRLFVCVGASLTVCLVLAFVALEIGGEWTVGGFVVLSTIFVIFTALLLNASAERERTAAYISFIYMTLFYLIPGFFHIAIAKFPFYSMNYPQDEIVRAAILVLVFTIFLLFGYWLYERAMAAHPPAGLPKAVADGPKSAGLVLPAAVAFIAVFVAWRMGIEYATTPLGDVEFTLSPLLNIELTTARILGFTSFALALTTLYSRRDGWAFAVAGITALGFVVLNSPLAIPRFILFSYALILLVTFSNVINRRKIIFLIAFFVAELTVFPAVSTLSRGDPTQLFTTSVFDYYISTGDLDGFQSTINVVMYVEKEGMKLGINLLSAILFFVPRDIWPGKSIGTGGESAGFMGYDFINVSSPLPSEFYVDFGWVGVVIGALALGWLLGYVDRNIREARASKDYLRMLPWATVVGYLFIVLRGSLVGVIGPFAFSYGIMVLTVKAVRAIHSTAKPKRTVRMFGRGRRLPLAAK